MSDASGQLALSLGRPRRPAPGTTGLPPVAGRRALDTPIILSSTRKKLRDQKWKDNAPDGHSLADQFKDVATGIIPGIYHLGKDAAIEAALPIRFMVDKVTGHKVKPEDYQPLSTGLARSLKSTGQDIIHPTRITRAVDDGTIVAKLLEDVGNVALVGGVASKALTAGSVAAEGAGATRLASGLGTAGRGLARVSKLGDTISDAPISIPRRIITGTTDAIGRKLATTAESGKFAGFDTARFSPTLAGRFSAEGRIAKPLVKEGERAKQQATGHVHQEFAKHAKETGISLDEQAAAVALMNGVGRVDELAARSGADVLSVHQGQARPEQNLTPSAADVSRRYLAGTLDPESVARIDSFQEFAGKQLDKATTRALDDESGFVSGALDPRQLGDDPIFAAENLARLTADAETVTPKQIEAAQKSLDDGTAYDEHLQAVLDDPSSYPAAWRPQMVAAQKLRAAGHKVPLRPEDVLASGMPRPRYIPGGESVNVVPRKLRPSQEQIRRGFGGLRGSSSEHQRVTSEVQSYSARTLAEKLGEQAGTAESNKALLKFAQDPSLKTVGDVVPAEVLDHFQRQAERDASVVGGGKAQVAQETKRRFGELVSQHLRDELGKEVFAGDRNAPAVGDFNPKLDKLFDQVSSESLTLPIGVKNALKPVAMPKGLNVPAEVLKFINTKFKGAVLPFSIRWQAGDAIGGAFLAAVGGGMPPWTFIRNMMDLKKLSPEAVDALFNNPKFVDSGLRFEGQQFVTENFMEGRKEPKTIIGRFQRGSFAFNEKINHYNRHAYLLGKVQELLDKKGLSLDDIDGKAAPGTSRLYRGSPITKEAGPGMPDWMKEQPDVIARNSVEGRWFTDDRKLAETYPTNRDPGVGNRLSYVDVPDAEYAGMRGLADQPASIRKLSSNPAAEAVLPESMLGRVKEVPEGARGGWNDPDVKKVIDEAILDANKTMGAFDDMSPLEQRVLKNVFPFYVWMRHITQLAYRTAVDNPARMMWTLRLGSFGSNEENLTDLPSWMSGSIKGPGGLLLPTNFLNPFNDVSDQVMNPKDTMLRALSPGIKIPTIGVTGLDPSKGLAPVSRPYGEERSPLSDMVYAGLQTFPLTRVGMQMSPEFTANKNIPGVGGLGFGAHPRYRSGQFMVDKNTGEPLPSNTPAPRLAALASLTGIPWPTDSALVQKLAGQKQKAASLKRKRRKHISVAK